MYIKNCHKDPKIEKYLEKHVTITFKDGNTETGFLIDSSMEIKYKVALYCRPYILLVGYTPGKLWYDYAVTFYKSSIKKIEVVKHGNVE